MGPFIVYYYGTFVVLCDLNCTKIFLNVLLQNHGLWSVESGKLKHYSLVISGRYHLLKGQRYFEMGKRWYAVVQNLLLSGDQRSHYNGLIGLDT